MPPPDTVIHITQGEFRTSSDPTVALATVLGSCVAACITDPVAGIGGMNHFLLPGNDPGQSSNIKYGAHSMEQLVNALLRAGANRRNFEVQLFGGANVVSGLSRIGDSNVQFARKYVLDEGMRLSRHDLGGSRGRRLRFWPATGRSVMEAFAMNNDPSVAPTPRPVRPAAAGSLELF